LLNGYTIEQAQKEAVSAFANYLKTLALDTPEEMPTVVRMASIGAILYSLEPVLDYTNLTINGGTSNIAISAEQVAVLGEVELIGAVR